MDFDSPEVEAGSALSRAAAGGRFGSLEDLRAVHSWLLAVNSEGEGGRGIEKGRVQDDLQRFLGLGVATGAILDERQDRWETQSLLDYWYTVLYRAGRRPDKPRLDPLEEALVPDLDDADCPYLGLDAFREENSRLFFGRQRLLEALLEKLGAAPMLAVVGISGSGKSSVVRAGLLPALAAGGVPGSTWWTIPPPIVPGSDPLDSLARLVLRVRSGPTSAPPPEDEVGRMAGEFRADPRRLLAMLDRPGGPPVAVVVDQFEEVFTLCNEPEAAKAFIDNLVEFARVGEGRSPANRVVLTMRSDFEVYVLKYEGLRLLFDAGLVTVTPMEREELRAAIERPAEQVGLIFEKGVVEALLEDTHGEPGVLPLLQFALLRLWEGRWHNKVRMEEYKRLGGIRAALRTAADELFDRMIPQNQDAARRIFLRIVRPGEGLEVTNKRAPLLALLAPLEDHDRTRSVLDELAKARLVRLTRGLREEDTQVEVAHEALVRNWPRLVEWLNDQRSAIVKRQRLELKVAEWVRLGRGVAAQLDSAQLRDAQDWLDGKDAAELGIIPDLRALVDASRSAIDRDQRLKEEAARNEIARARELAAAEGRAMRMWRLLLILVIPITIIAVVAAVLAYRERDRANREAARAVAEGERANQEYARFVATNLLKAASRDVNDPDRNVFLAQRALAAIESRKLELTPSILQRLESLYRKPDWGFDLSSPDDTPIAFSPDGRWLAEGGSTILQADSGVAQTFAAAPKGVTEGPDNAGTVAREERTGAIAYSPDGKLFAVGTDAGSVTLWETSGAARSLSRALPRQRGAITAIAFNRDEKSNALATVVDTRKVTIWDLSNSKQISTVPDLDNLPNRLIDRADRLILDVAYAPGRDHLAAAYSDGKVILWDTAKGTPLMTMGHPQGTKVLGVAFHPKGDRIATRCTDGRVHLWDVATGAEVLPSLETGRGESNWLGGLAFSPDGSRLAASGIDETVVVGVWDIPGGTKRFSIGIRNQDAHAVAFRPDLGRFVVTAAESSPRYQPGTAPTGTILEFELRPIDDVLARIKREQPHIELKQYLDILKNLSPEKHRLMIEARERAERGAMVEASALGVIAAEALALMRESLEIPGLDAIADRQSRRLVAEVLIREARLRAFEDKGGETALRLFAKAREIDKDGSPDPRREADQWRAFGLIDRGQLAAMKGDVDAADLAFRQARALHPASTFDLAYAKQLAVTAKLNQGMRLVREGKVDEAIAALREADRFDSQQVASESWNDLCWWGSLHGRASDVGFAGDLAVKLAAPDSVAMCRDTRGLARALTGQLAEAAEDFLAFLQWARSHPNFSTAEEMEDRRRWVEALNEGRNPFDPASLDRLREKELKRLSAEPPIIPKPGLLELPADVFARP